MRSCVRRDLYKIYRIKDMRSFEKPPYFDNLVQFMADMSDTRTIQQFADENGIHRDTITKFKRNHMDVLNIAIESARALYIPKLRQAAYQALYAKLSKSDLALKLALQVTGDLVEKSEVKQSYSIEEKRERAKALMAQLSEKLGNKPNDNPPSNV